MSALADRRLWLDLARTFGPDLWAHRQTMLASCVFRVLAIGATLVAPWPLKIIVDHVLSSRPLPHPLRLFLPQTSPQRIVIAMALAIVTITAVRAIACSPTSKRFRRRFKPRIAAASSSCAWSATSISSCGS